MTSVHLHWSVPGKIANILAHKNYKMSIVFLYPREWRPLHTFQCRLDFLL